MDRHRPAAFLVLLSLLLAAPTALALTADELIAKNVEARGGLARLSAISSIRATGIVRIGGEDGFIEQTYTLLQSRPGKLRRERSMQGLTAVTAYDGQVGWTVSPFRGRKEPQLLTPDTVRGLAVDADLDGPLVDYRKKGYTVTYAGTEDVDGTEAHKLHVTLSGGDSVDVFLDPDYFLEIREVNHRIVRGVEEESETDPGNYGKVNGLVLPFSMESGPKGGSKNFRITFTKIEVNVPVDASTFRYPGDAAAPAKRGDR